MRALRLYGTTILAIVSALAIISITVAGSDGGKRQFRSDTLTGYQEVVGPGPISTTGTGSFEATLVDDTTIAYTLTYGGLEGGTVTQAHIHFGQRALTGLTPENL